MSFEKVLIAFEAMVRGRVVFGVIVGKILGAFAPVDEEMALADTIAYPIEAHIHGFGASLFDCVVANAGGACIVGLDGSGWLWVSHVVEDCSEHGSLLSVVE